MPKNRGFKVHIKELDAPPETADLSEAVTIKNQAKSLLKSITALLTDKALPSGVRSSLETASEAMRKNWADLATEADEESKANTQPAEVEEVIKQVDGKWYLYTADGKQKLGGPYDTEEAAEKREKQVKMFQSQPEEAAAGTEVAANAEAEPPAEPKPNVSEAYDSLDGMAQRVRSAFEAQYPQLFNYQIMQSGTWWVADVYAGHAEMGNALVAHAQGKCYAIGYTMDDTGNFQFAPRSDWQEVLMTYRLVATPSAIGAAAETADSDTSITACTIPVTPTDPPTEAEATTPTEAQPEAPADEPLTESLAESFDGADITLAEASPQLDASRSPLTLDVALIRPGFGNKKDNHYYSRDMLEKYAAVFTGAKMYLTDHKENERSVRNEVSVIDGIDRYREDGTPIARVTVFDPNFAESVRARAQAGKLDTLECSILADGTARRGTVDGREAKIVESITSVRAVDWVTRAGAGGHAMSIAENEDAAPAETPAQAEPTPPAPVQPPPPPAALQEAQVTVILSESKLPTEAQEWLAEAEYFDERELMDAITKARNSVKKMTGSGKPFAHGAKLNENEPTDPEAAKRRGDERFRRIMREVGQNI